MTDEQQLYHPRVRDLVWAMASPSLLAPAPDVVCDHACQALLATYRDWWQRLDTQNAALEQWLALRPDSRLGYYFEQLVAFWLQSCVARGYYDDHVRIDRGRQTLGEFDFLFMGEDRILYHWETAVKFYLAFQDQVGHIRWYGPNPADRLENKLARMFQHQLRLSATPEGAEWLESLKTEVNFRRIVPQALVKGYLFYPLHQDWRHVQWSSAPISAAHARGWWLRCSELAAAAPVLNRPEYRWLMLPRSDWLASRFLDERESQQENYLLHFEQLALILEGHFQGPNQAVLVAQMMRAKGQQWREISRGFVVAPDWPNTGAY